MQFSSNGKILLTGEYLVLKGATALAIPLSMGAELEVIPSGTVQNTSFDWETWVKEDRVFQGRFDSDANLLSGNDHDLGKTLSRILKALITVSGKKLFVNSGGTLFRSKLDFPMSYGLGSSSTLVSNLARWSGTDAFEVLEKTFGGSGYDLACAVANKPVLFKRESTGPTWTEVDFYPDFHEQLFFVYLNTKMNSRDAIASFSGKATELSGDAESRVSEISAQIPEVKDAGTFSVLLQEHESLLATILGIEPVAKTHFPDFKGTVKSLGAWGGDFVLAVSEKDPVDYFRSKGYHTILPYNKLVKPNTSG